MNVGLSIHNLAVVGILAAIFAAIMKLAAPLVANIPVLGQAVGFLAH